MTTGAVRYEHDLLGERAVPADAYYGVRTLRALENCVKGITANRDDLRRTVEHSIGIVTALNPWR